MLSTTVTGNSMCYCAYIPLETFYNDKTAISKCNTMTQIIWVIPTVTVV